MLKKLKYQQSVTQVKNYAQDTMLSSELQDPKSWGWWI